MVHIRALKQALNHGLKFGKVHRVVEFQESAWLKSYIDMNTDYRKKAKNNFEKDFYKLMNNSVFEKTIENVRNHKNLKLVCSEKKRKRLAPKHSYRSTIRFSVHFIAMDMRKTEVNINKCILGQRFWICLS